MLRLNGHFTFGLHATKLDKYICRECSRDSYAHEPGIGSRGRDEVGVLQLQREVRLRDDVRAEGPADRNGRRGVVGRVPLDVVGVV